MARFLGQLEKAGRYLQPNSTGVEGWVAKHSKDKQHLLCYVTCTETKAMPECIWCIIGRTKCCSLATSIWFWSQTQDP